MSGQNDFSVQAQVSVDGTPVSDDLHGVLEQVVIDQNLHLPDMFMLTFRDQDRQVLQTAGIRIGSRVVIEAAAADETSPQALLTAEVTAIEADYDQLGSRAIVRGYDPSHRFHRGRGTHTYRNVTDSDLARTVAQRAGVEIGQIDETQTTHDHVSQSNVSDWDFLKGRALEIGFQIGFKDGKFKFTRPEAASGAPGEGDFATTDPLQLVMGHELIEFRPRITSSEQVRNVEVRGWDPARKQKVVAQAAAAATSADLSTTPGKLAATFDAPSFVSVDRPLSDQSIVDATARAVAEQIGSAYAEAFGVARGNPHIRPGVPFSVSVVADDFVGKYTPTAARHIFDHHGYRTEFTVSGRQDRSLLGLAIGAVGGAGTRLGGGGQPINGVVVGIVTDNNDPEQLGRVKLAFPWLSDDYESDWVRLAQMGAGPDSGAVFLPEVHDEVLVCFEFGDVRRPYVLGGLYNGVDKPRLGDGLFDNGKVKRRGFVSRRGHRFVLFDDSGKSGIALMTSDDKLRIALKETGSEVHVYADGRIVIESTQGLEIKSQQNISLESSAQLTIKGQGGVKIESSGVVDIDGSLIQLN
jgi:phage protein D